MKTPKQKEAASIQKRNANKKGKYIRILCWTNEDHSSAETHAKSITAAIKELKKFQGSHANWKLEMVSEPAGNPPYIDKINAEINRCS